MIISGDDSPEEESNRAAALAHVPVVSVMTHDFRHGNRHELERIIRKSNETYPELAAPVSSGFAGHHGHSASSRSCEPGPASGFLWKRAKPSVVGRLRAFQPCFLAHCQAGREIVPSVADGVSDC